MFPRQKRLHKEADIQKVFRKGQRRIGTYVTVYSAPSTVFRATVVVGKKVSKKAVVRNRLKRKIRAIVQKVPQELPRDIIVLPRKSAIEAPQSELSNELHRLLLPKRNHEKRDRMDH